MTIQEREASLDSPRKAPLLAIITGGRQPPKKGSNWLKDMNPWSVFLTRNDKISKINLLQFQVREKYNNSTALFVFLPKEEPLLQYVSNVDFSNEYELMDIIDKGDDGTVDWPNPDRGLEVITNIKQDDTIPGETR